MASTFSDEEREKIINLAVSHILEKGDSYRKTADYLTNCGYKISHVTVKDYCDRYITSCGNDYKMLEEMIDLNKAKGIADENVRNRVLGIAKIYANSDFEIEDIADNMDLSFQTVYNDLNVRLPEIASKESIELYKKVKEKCERNSLSNLRNRNGR